MIGRSMKCKVEALRIRRREEQRAMLMKMKIKRRMRKEFCVCWIFISPRDHKRRFFMHLQLRVSNISLFINKAKRSIEFFVLICDKRAEPRGFAISGMQCLFSESFLRSVISEQSLKCDEWNIKLDRQRGRSVWRVTSHEGAPIALL